MYYLRNIFTLLLLFWGSLNAQENQTQAPQPPFEFESEEDKELFLKALENDTTEANPFMDEFLHMLFLLGLLIAFLILVVWVMKRLAQTRVQQANISSSIKILEQRSLSQKSTLYHIAFEEKQFIIGESANGISLIHSESSEPPTEKQNEQFSKMLEAEEKKRT